VIERIGKFCYHFRKEVLGLTLTEFSKITGKNLKSIHAFEKGRANNIKYLYLYYDLADAEQKKEFAIRLFELSKEV
jgi:hypothetical protein